MNKNISLISALWNYTKKPDYNLAPIEKSFKNKLGDIIKYWSLGIVVAFFAAILSAALLNNIGVDDSQNMLQDFFASSSVLMIVLIVFFIGPITEELTFRLGLRYSPYRFSFAFMFILLILFELAIANSYLAEKAFDMTLNYLGIFPFLGILLALIVLLGGLFGYILSKCKLSQKIDNFYQNKFQFIFYILTITFGVIHFFNFANFKELWFVLPFLVAPQLFLGFILAYIRMRYSLSWAIFYHFFHNTLAALPILLLTQISDESMDIILEGTDNKIMSMPFSDRLLLVSGGGISLMVLLLVIIFFSLLMKNHLKYLKLKKSPFNKIEQG